MAKDPEELSHRLDRIEQLLRHRAEPASRVPAGPEVRSARSIVNRVDDVWVAVTEGNERVVAAVERLGAAVTALAATVAPPDRTGAVDTAAQGPEAGAPADGDTHGRRAPEPAEPGVHLRLNRIEEALAGLAGRLEDLTDGVPAAAAHRDQPGIGDAEAQAVTAAVERLDAEIRRLGQRVDSLADAIERSAAHGVDDTLTQRLGRLRDQFRR